MPFTEADAPEHVPKSMRSQWAKIWNSTFESCRDDGRTADFCETKAFRIANGVIKRDMALGSDDWIEVFRAGDYGAKGKYGEAELDEIVRNTKPLLKGDRVPNVVGHPENDKPAFGWVADIKREGGSLFAKLRDVPEQFKQWVRDKFYVNRSVALTANPLALAHVGWLGAMAPAVPGMKPIGFDAAGAHSIEFAEEEEMRPEEIKAHVEGVIEKFFSKLFGKQEPPKFSEADVQKRVASSVADAVRPLKEQIEAEAAARKKFADEQAMGAHKAAAAAAKAKLAAAGKWLPAYDKMGMPLLLAEFAALPEIEVGEADKKTKKSPLALFVELLEAMKNVPMGGELAGGQPARKGAIKFNAPGGGGLNFEADPTGVALAAAADELAKKEKIGYGEALRRLRAEGFTPPAGGAEAGAA